MHIDSDNWGKPKGAPPKEVNSKIYVLAGWLLSSWLAIQIYNTWLFLFESITIIIVKAFYYMLQSRLQKLELWNLLNFYNR